MSTKPSLLFITVDCLRADHVGFMGYARPTTPFLDSLASESLVIPTAIVGGAPTYYSLPSILASRSPFNLGRDLIGLAPGEPTLASILGQAGYATAAFAGGNPYISPRFGYDQGFDHFCDFLAEVPPSRESAPAANSLRRRVNRKIEQLSSRGALLKASYNELYFQYCQRWGTKRPSSFDELRRFPSADILVDQARAWISSIGDRPFFLWLHFMDPHSPYYPVAEALGTMKRENLTPFRARYLNSYWNRGDKSRENFSRYREEVMGLYDATIRWVDTQTARLVETLRRFRRWDNCLLSFTADHGEEFLEHGGRYHQPRKLIEELIHVPMLLRVPGTPPSRLTSSPFSLLHLAPTLLDAMNVAIPAEFQGRSHWRHIQHHEDWNDPAVVECGDGCSNPFHRDSRLRSRILAIREKRYKLVLRFDPRAEELFDLQEDPAELQPLPENAAMGVRRRLLKAALAHLRQSHDQGRMERRLSGLIRDMQLQAFSAGLQAAHAVPM
ncbi:MAG TPA: sulfatase [Terriglobales bacterium]